MVRTVAESSGIHIVSFVGYQGSGKSLLGRKLARHLCTEHIETSDIVKAEHEGLTRAELSSTGEKTKVDPDWLGREMMSEVERVVKEQNRTVAVISGVREQEVHKYLQRQKIVVWPVEVNAEAAVRYARVIRLNKVKTTEAFLDQEFRERELGLPEVLKTCKFAISTSETTDPQELIEAVKAVLQAKGARF